MRYLKTGPFSSAAEVWDVRGAPFVQIIKASVLSKATKMSGFRDKCLWLSEHPSYSNIKNRQSNKIKNKIKNQSYQLVT